MTEGVVPLRRSRGVASSVADGVTLDAGPLILLERGDRRVRRFLEDAERSAVPIAVPAGVLAQVWRGSPRQHRLAGLVKIRRVGGSPRAQVVPLDRNAALRAGILCRQSEDGDVVEASVVLCARDRNHVVLTTDPDDLLRLDPELPVYAL